ncbi:hypothetical protein [Kitasatospora griseola]|uniref:hypothetical protein n=1 Tax=Kitasatospora griseola TaxID=2064 RepID=UPI00166FFBE1|nr:hypothetical protein [Kitasatospora griseola]GGQ84193.1 hypothetical protein GCM10010195_44770 [Kitasatospora griseola]
MAVTLALALVMAGFTPPAGANAEGIGSTACQFDNWATWGVQQSGAVTGTGSQTSIGMGCAADAPAFLADAATGSGDLLVVMTVQEATGRTELADGVREIHQLQGGGQRLSDIVKQRAATYGPGVYPTPADDVTFDGTVRLLDNNNVVVVVPASEVGVQANWWQKVIATSTSLVVGLAVAVLCFAPFAVGAPMAGPICAAVSGAVGGFVNELLNALFDQREFDGDFWTEALTQALVGAVAGPLLGKFMNWAEIGANPMMQSVGTWLRDFGRTVGGKVAEVMGAAAGTAVVIARNLKDSVLRRAGQVEALDVADAPDSSMAKAAGFLAADQDRYPLSDPLAGQGTPPDPSLPTIPTVKLVGVPRSYTGGYFGGAGESAPNSPFGPDGFQASFTYDNAVFIISMLQGRQRDLDRARRLGYSLLYAQDHDPAHDGSIRASYLPDPFITTLGRDYPVGTPYIGSWSVYTGNMAWAGMAFVHLYRATGDSEFRNGALRVANWIETNATDTRGAGGYTGGFSDTSAAGDGSGMVQRTWKATEHNIDVGAFYFMLSQVTGDHDWKERSDNAFTFVKSMLSADRNHLWTGTGLDGRTVNEDAVPEDVQTWAYLATLDHAYARTADWAAGRMAATDGPFSGVSFSTVDTSGVWFEGTAHLLAVYQTRQAPGDADKAALLISTLQRAQNSAPHADGAGLVAASHDGLDTGQGDRYYASLHTGATAWYLLAGQGGNPFRLAA